MRALLRRLIELQAEINCIKPLYKEQDEILEKLIAIGFTTKALDGYVVTLVDNYSKKNTVYKTVAQRRFDVVISDVE